MSITAEIVTMKPVGGLTKEQFIDIVDHLEKEFHSKQEGFIDSELLYDEKNNVWYMIQHWESHDQLKTASKNIFIDSSAEIFVKSLEPKSVKMTILPQLSAWN